MGGDGDGSTSRGLIADLALIFHWSLTELEALPIDELIIWRDIAVERWNAMHPRKEG